MNNLGYGRRKLPRAVSAITCMDSVGLTTGEPYLLKKKWLSSCPLFYKETVSLPPTKFAKYIKMDKRLNPLYYLPDFTSQSGVCINERYDRNVPEPDLSIQMDLLDKSVTTPTFYYQDLFGVFESIPAVAPMLRDWVYMVDSEKWLVTIDHYYGSLNRYVRSLVEVDMEGNALIVGHYQDPEDESKGTAIEYGTELLGTGGIICTHSRLGGDWSLIEFLVQRIDWEEDANQNPVDDPCHTGTTPLYPYSTEAQVRQKVQYYLEDGHLSPRLQDLKYSSGILAMREYPNTTEFIEYVKERVVNAKVPDAFIDRIIQPILANEPFTVNVKTSCSGSVQAATLSASELLTPYDSGDYRANWLSTVVNEYPELFEYSIADPTGDFEIAASRPCTLHTLALSTVTHDFDQFIARSDELVSSSKLDTMTGTIGLRTTPTFDKDNGKYLATVDAYGDDNIHYTSTGKVVVCDEDGSNARVLEVLPYDEAKLWKSSVIAAAGGNLLVIFVQGQTIQSMVVIDYQSDSYTVRLFDEIGVYEGEPLPSGTELSLYLTSMHNLPDSNLAVINFPNPSVGTFQTFMNFITDDCITIKRLEDEVITDNYLRDFGNHLGIL